MYRISIAVFICLVCGCKMGPDYQHPAISVPDSFIYEQKDARDTANTDWWKDFHDPVLDSLITEALANNKSVKIAAASVEQAAAILTQTRAPLYPQAAYSGGGARQRANELSAVSRLPGFSNPQDLYEVLAGASWEIDFWGRIQRLSEVARADLLASQEARRGVILSLVASVANSYIQLCGLDEQLATARRNLDTYAQSVRLFDLQYQHGQVTKMTLEQARTQYETAAAVIPQLESQIAQTENAICVLLGRNPGSIQRGKSISELTMPVIPAGLPSELLDRRPDLAQAQQNLIAANAQIGAAKALYFPTISLTGAYGTQSSELSDLFSGPSRTWNYAGSVTGPIFTAGSISGQVKQAQAAQAAALLNYENVILIAFSDVENALVACQRLADQLQAQGKLVGSLKEYDRLAWLQYNGGYTPYLTVLNAESQLFNAELSYVQNRTDALASYVRIYQAMGGGWIANAEQLADAQ
ncbi:MAG: efflux transporter outer membrane subunit [Anaerohalosphaeraceae bacterium]